VDNFCAGWASLALPENIQFTLPPPKKVGILEFFYFVEHNQ
jgi:hypothetical protein